MKGSLDRDLKIEKLDTFLITLGQPVTIQEIGWHHWIHGIK
jgi:hypothetical protein